MILDIGDPTPDQGDWTRWHEFDWDCTFYKRLVWRAASDLQLDTGPLLYQREPNLRIHSPGGRSVPWHTDAEFGHLPEEWNVWVPLTNCTDDSQRLWIKDETDTHPVVVHPGQAFVFHGATTRHGVIRNRTDATRYSFDFRILPEADYRDEGRVTVQHGVPLRLGDYWRSL